MGFGHVSVEVPALCRRLVTVVALVARQTSVYPSVSCHAAAARKLLSANITFVGFFVHVHGTQVHHQSVLSRKRLITTITFKNFRSVRKLV